LPYPPQAGRNLKSQSVVLAANIFGLPFTKITEATMKKTEELIVITRTYDLILWSCNHTSRFPRQHRFVLGERLERTLYDLLETLIQAKYSRERIPLLNQANLKLEVLRFQVRLAKDLQCLKAKSYTFAARQIDEIGKLVGDWLKAKKSV
jgi:hypothetical protein